LIDGCVGIKAQFVLILFIKNSTEFKLFLIKMESEKYSILLPTYNERENLPIIVWLIVKYLTER